MAANGSPLAGKVPLDAHQAAALWFEVGDRAIAARNPGAALLAFDRAAEACFRAGDPGRELDARLEIAAALCQLERWQDFERAVGELDDLHRRKNLPEGVLVRARVFARIARVTRGGGEHGALLDLVKEVRSIRREAKS